MSEYTKEELDEFRKLVELTESSDQVARIKGRLGQESFVARVGKEKCDAMFQVLCNELDQ